MDKVLLIICEGRSDNVTLFLPTKNFIKENKIRIHTSITHGDIALKENATKETCYKEIKKLLTI